MNQKTIKDLAEVARLDADIESMRRQISSIRLACEHLDHKIEFVETLQLEMMPARICVVCHKRLPGTTDSEKEALWRQHYEDLGADLSPDILEQILHGI